MNQRIQELGDQAWDYALDHKTVNGEAAFGSFINKNFSDLLLEKFAELIVKECARVITNGGYWTDILGNRKNASPDEISQMVKEHFGVK